MSGRLSEILSTRQGDKVYCEHCGMQLSGDAAFCMRCGAAVQEGGVRGQGAGLDARQGARQGVRRARMKPMKSARPVNHASPAREESSAHSVHGAQDAHSAHHAQIAHVEHATRGDQGNRARQQSQKRSAGTREASAASDYPNGCTGAAWADVKWSGGWFGKAFIGGLLMLVPIVGFFTIGYALNWASELPRKRRNPMPETFFTVRNFLSGFYWTVLVLLVGVFVWLVSFVLSFLPVVGTICAIFFAIFMWMFANICSLRIGLSGRFGPAFDVSYVWAACKRRPDSLFAATVLPALIVWLVLVGIAICYAAFVGMLGYGAGINFGTLVSMSVAEGVARLQMIDSVWVGVFAFLTFIFVYLVRCAEAFVIIFECRAVGHYVERYVPEWGRDPILKLPTRKVKAGPGQLVLLRSTGEQYRIASLPAIVGKGNNSDVQIKGNGTVSRTHARFNKVNGSFVVEDLHSTNKTYMNGFVIIPGKLYRVESGSELRLGNENLRVMC